METTYIPSIIPFLRELQPLEPLPVDVASSALPCNDIKAVVWDIYGTLLISTSGDIEAATFSTQHLLRACEAAGIGIAGDHPEQVARDMLQQYHDAIYREHARARADGFPWPEVDIRAIWQQVFSAFSSSLSFPDSNPAVYVSCSAFVFELLSNPVYPMPGMREILTSLHANGILLGIVSNAQFYTPVIMNYFLSGEAVDTDAVSLFESDLCVYSYKLLRAKPDRVLFDNLVASARDRYGLHPYNILYVGNDIRNDIHPAMQAGLKTALFAGDSRSLRQREHDPEYAGVKPDFIVSHLQQVCSDIAGFPPVPV